MQTIIAETNVTNGLSSACRTIQMQITSNLGVTWPKFMEQFSAKETKCLSRQKEAVERYLLVKSVGK